jgi:hypothetical protein
MQIAAADVINGEHGARYCVPPDLGFEHFAWRQIRGILQRKRCLLETFGLLNARRLCKTKPP